MTIPQQQKEILTRLYDVGLGLLILRKSFEFPVNHLPLLASQRPIYIGGYLENPNNSLYVISYEKEPSLSVIIPARADGELTFLFAQQNQKPGFAISQMMRSGTHSDARWNVTSKDSTDKDHDYHLYERWDPNLLENALNHDQLTPDPIKLVDFHKLYKKW